MTEQEQFIADLAETVQMIAATDRQREVYKASLRYAISHAVRKASQRDTPRCAHCDALALQVAILTNERDEARAQRRDGL